MALSFQQVAPKLGYELLSSMQKDMKIGGPSAGYFMENPENPGQGASFGVKQAQVMGGFDPGAFNDYTFDWQGTGKGNTGTLTAFDKAGKQVGTWSQKDEQLGESLMNAGMLAAAAFGGLALAGQGPLAGALGTGTAPAAAAPGTTATTASAVPTAAAGSSSAGMLQGLPAMAGDFGAVGASTSAFDTVLSLTGSEALAGAAGKAGALVDAVSGGISAAGGGGGWLSNTWGAITGTGGSGSLLGSLFGGSNLLRDLLPIIGAGFSQVTAEKMAKDQRDWQSSERQKDRDFQEKQASDTRRRQMPSTGPGLLGKFRVIPGGANGG